MGGSWERLVKSVKTAMYATIPTRTPTDPMFYSYLMEIEDTINSRPLTYLPLDAEEGESLTPNHFLRLSSGTNKPIGTFSDDAKVLKSHWMTCQLYSTRFWRRWVAEYMPELTKRGKWYAKAEPLQKGDLVLIVDPKAPRNTWTRGRIDSITKGKDEQVRSATVRTSTSLLVRPAIKLAKLNIVDGVLGSEHPQQDTVVEDVRKSVVQPRSSDLA
jgi:hypothetical protein